MIGVNARLILCLGPGYGPAVAPVRGDLKQLRSRA